MGKPSRDKGARNERAVVLAHREHGIPARRVPYSGAHPDHDSHDVDIYWKGEDHAPLKAEVKARRTLPKSLTDWLGDNDVLWMKGDRSEAIVAVPERVWWQIMGKK